MCACMQVCMYECMHVYASMHVCMCLCMYVHLLNLPTMLVAALLEGIRAEGMSYLGLREDVDSTAPPGFWSLSSNAIFVAETRLSATRKMRKYAFYVRMYACMYV